MLLHWGLPILDKALPAELVADLRSTFTDPSYPYEAATEGVPFYNGCTGDVVFAMPAHGMRRISRTKMRRHLCRGLTVRWGKSFRELRAPAEKGPVEIAFEDGSSAEADFVVGSDGPNSKVRLWLLGEDKGKAKASEHAICSGIIHYGSAEKSKFLRVHPVASAGITPIGSLYLGAQDVPDPEKPETWSFHIVRIFHKQVEPMEGDAAIQYMKELCQDLKDPPFRSAFDWIPADSKIFVNQLHTWDTIPWDDQGGRVVLIGDAAHAMTPSKT
jgi:2-polyprenyl-6-methoxyphenol hydroxylase-like FAD-dependent oxidoreductase